MIPARVALLTNTLPPYRNSLFEAIGSRVRELRVFVSSPADTGIEVECHRKFCVTVQKSFALASSRIHPTGFSEVSKLILPYDTGRQLQRYRPDVVISGECGLRSLQSAVYCLLRPRCPLVLWATLSERTEAGRGRMRTAVRRWLFKRADAVLVNGRSGRGYVERLGCDPVKVTEVPYTVPMTFTRRGVAVSEPQMKRLLYVGQLIERKGILPFLETLRAFCHANPNVPVKLSLVGSGPLERYLRAQILGGQGTIDVLGSVPYSELPKVYASSDIFVFPTLADEWGTVVNEAMASGLPVLGSVHSQAVDELLEDGVTGWVFRPDNPPDALARLGQALSTSPARLREMGVRAAERISIETPDSAAERIVNAIAKLLLALKESRFDREITH